MTDDRHGDGRRQRQQQQRRQRGLADYAMAEALCLEPLFLPGLASFFCAIHPIGPSKTIFLMKVNPAMIGDLKRATTEKLGESPCGPDLASQPRTIDLLRRLYTSDVHPWRDFVDDAIKDATFVYKARYPMPALYDYLLERQAKARQERRADAAATAASAAEDVATDLVMQYASQVLPTDVKGEPDAGPAVMVKRSKKPKRRTRRGGDRPKQEENKRCFYGDLPPPWSERHASDWKEYALPDDVIGDYTFLAKEIVIYKRLAAAWLETRRQREAEIDHVNDDEGGYSPLAAEQEMASMYFFAQLYGVDLCPKTGVTRGVILGNHSDTQIDDSGLLVGPDDNGSGGRSSVRVDPPDTSIADAIRYASQLTFALAQTHLCGIAHLDIKPDNVLDVNKHYLSTIDKCFPPAVDRDYSAENGVELDNPGGDGDLSSSHFHARVCKLIDFDVAAFVAPTAIMKVNHFETAVTSSRQPKVIKGYANRNILTSHRYIPRYNIFGTDNFIAPERLVEDDDAFNAQAYDIFALGATIGSFMLNNSMENGRGAFLFDCPPNYSEWREHADQMAFIGESQYPLNWKLSPSLAFGWISSSNYTPLDKFGAAGDGLGNVSSTYSPCPVLPPTLLPERTRLPEIWNNSLLYCRKCADESGWNRFLDTLEDAREKSKQVPILDASLLEGVNATSYSGKARRNRHRLRQQQQEQQVNRPTSVFDSLSSSLAHPARVSESRLKKRSKLIVTEALETQTPADRGNTTIDAGDWLGIKRFIDLNQSIATYPRLGSTAHIRNDAEWMETSLTAGLPSLLNDDDDYDHDRKLPTPLCPSCNKYRRGPLRLWEMFVMMDTLMQAAPTLLARLRPDSHVDDESRSKPVDYFNGGDYYDSGAGAQHAQRRHRNQTLTDVLSSEVVDAMNEAIMFGDDALPSDPPAASSFSSVFAGGSRAFSPPRPEALTRFDALCERLPVPQFAQTLVSILSSIVDASTVEHRFGGASEKSFRWVQWFQMSSLDDIVVSSHAKIEQWWSSVCDFMADIESKHDSLESMQANADTGNGADNSHDDGPFVVSATDQFFYRIASVVFGASSMVRHCTGYLATTRPDAMTLLCKDVPAVIASSSDVIYAPPQPPTGLVLSPQVDPAQEERRRIIADEMAERVGQGYFGIHRVGFFNCVSQTACARVLFPDEGMMRRCTSGTRLMTAPNVTPTSEDTTTLIALKKSAFLLQEEIAFRFWKFARSLPDSVQLKILGRHAGNLYSRVLDQSSLQPGVLYGLELFKMLWQEEFDHFWPTYVKDHYRNDVTACKASLVDPEDASNLQRHSKSIYNLVVNFSFVIVSCLVHASQVFMSEASSDMDMISFIFHQFMVQTASAQFDDAVHNGGKSCVLSLGDLHFYREAHLGGPVSSPSTVSASVAAPHAPSSYSSYARNRRNARTTSTALVNRPTLVATSSSKDQSPKSEQFNLKSTLFWIRGAPQQTVPSLSSSRSTGRGVSSHSRRSKSGRRLFNDSSSSSSVTTAASPSTASTPDATLYPTGVTRLVFSDAFDKSGDAEVHIPSYRNETIVVHFEESLEDLREQASSSTATDSDDESNDNEDNVADASADDVAWIGPHKARSIFFQHLLEDATISRDDPDFESKRQKSLSGEDESVKALRLALSANNPSPPLVEPTPPGTDGRTAVKDVANTCNVVSLDDVVRHSEAASPSSSSSALNHERDEVFDLKSAESQLIEKMSRLTTSSFGTASSSLPISGVDSAALAAVDVSSIKASSHKLPTVNYDEDHDSTSIDSGSYDSEEPSSSYDEESYSSDEEEDHEPSSLSSKKNQVVLESLRPELFKRFGASYYKAKNTLDIAISQRCRGSYPLPRLLVWYEGLAAYMPLNEEQACILRKLINQWYCVSIDASIEYSSVTLFLVMVYCCTRIAKTAALTNQASRREASMPQSKHQPASQSTDTFSEWAKETVIRVLADSAPMHPVKEIADNDDAIHAAKVVECFHHDAVPMFMDLVRMMIARID
jgi:serine/threonine protein kinase